MSTPQLRPLGVGEILDVAIKIYWRNAKTLLGLVVLIVLPAQILENLALASLPVGSSRSHPAAFFAGELVVAIVAGLSSLLATAACFKAVSDAYLGTEPGIVSSWRFALRRLLAVLVVTVLVYVLSGLAMIALVIPGIYLWVSFSVSIPVLLMERTRATRALGRSRELVRGRWWSTFALLVIVSLATGVVTSIIGGILDAVSITQGGVHALTGFVVATASGAVSKTIATPLTAAAVTVLYIDLRVRKEAFDLRLLAERVGIAAPDHGDALLPPPPAPPRPPSGPQPPFWPPPPGWKPDPGPLGDAEAG